MKTVVVEDMSSRFVLRAYATKAMRCHMCGQPIKGVPFVAQVRTGGRLPAKHYHVVCMPTDSRPKR